MRNEDWNFFEVEAAVMAYFQIFENILQNRKVNKAEFIRNLNKIISKRTRGSIEFKFGNISAILFEAGLNYLEGYKPYNKYQTLLEEIVYSYLNLHPKFKLLLEKTSPISKPILQKDIQPFKKYITPMPDAENVKEDLKKFPRNIDYATRDFRNRELGKKGEEFIYLLEKSSLRNAGYSNLASKVKWISKEEGDGAGFDILSFDQSGNDKFIEVKTTTLSISTSFYMSDNEIKFSERHKKNYLIYRNYNFFNLRQFYTLDAKILSEFIIKPIQFLINPKPEHITKLKTN